VEDKHIVNRSHKIVRHDWKHSHPLDLTDEGLMKDLEKRGGKGEEDLALRKDQVKRKKRRRELETEVLATHYAKLSEHN
jgi:hypothetical protein